MSVSAIARNTPYGYVYVPQNATFTFNVKPLSAVQPPWCSIFRIQALGSTGDRCRNGCRMPYVGFEGGSATKLWIRFDNANIDDQGVNGTNQAALQLAVNVESTVVIALNGQGLSVKVNNQAAITTTLWGLPSFGNGYFWRSDDFYPACNVTLGPVTITGPASLSLTTLANNTRKADVSVNVGKTLVTFEAKVLGLKSTNCTMFRLRKTGVERAFYLYLVQNTNSLFFWADTQNSSVNRHIATLATNVVYKVSIAISENTLITYIDGKVQTVFTAFDATTLLPHHGNFELWQSDSSACNAQLSDVTFGASPKNYQVINLSPTASSPPPTVAAGNALVLQNGTKSGIENIRPYSVFKFDIMPLGTQPAYCKILRYQQVQRKTDKCTNGCQMPYVGLNWETNKAQLWIRADASYYSDYGLNGNEFPLLTLPNNIWTNVIIAQRGNHYTVHINGVLAGDFTTGGDVQYGAANLWISDNYNSALCNVKITLPTVTYATPVGNVPTINSTTPTFVDKWNSTKWNNMKANKAIYNATWGSSWDWGNALRLNSSDPYQFGIRLDNNSGTGFMHARRSYNGQICAKINTPIANGAVFAVYTTSNGNNPSTGWDEFDMEWLCDTGDGLATNFIHDGNHATIYQAPITDGTGRKNHTFCLYWDLNKGVDSKVLWHVDGVLYRSIYGYSGRSVDEPPQFAGVSYWSTGRRANEPNGSCPWWGGFYGNPGANVTTWVSNLEYKTWD